MKLRLHGYWRSSAAYRVRLALGLKGLAYEQVPHDLRTGAQATSDYRTLNPQALLPTLEADDLVLTQSPAILEWLDERFPDPPLLPADPDARAVVRAMAAIVACDIHPVNNLRILSALRRDFDAQDVAVSRWIRRWITQGFEALEMMIARRGSGFAYGDTPTVADCHLLPQVYNALRFDLDMAPFPHIAAAAAKLDGRVPQAHPDAQPDAP
ncbi:maleylacetoacetate isomerase [uncultured Sphingomonas sp.]|uniref:maleylacetoacetate isomerase n=1 Tax=uncultured Sphingomonas sp. TaxID=158754 RepID=UPI002621031C|nr:maleylacetoacetate isomerase [uncultured Sphingomonas sp.]